jgi:hypothetical protein
MKIKDLKRQFFEKKADKVPLTQKARDFRGILLRISFKFIGFNV